MLLLRPLALGAAKRQRVVACTGALLLLRPSLQPPQSQASRWLSTEVGSTLRLNNIRDNPAARRNSKRVGRGIGSGKGKTSGRGHKGKKQRRGNHGLSLHEGGQMPIQRRVPKSGFTNNQFKENLQRLNCGKLQDWIDQGRLDPSEPITLKHLHDAHIVGRIAEGVKLLGEGSDRLTTPVDIEVSRASVSAIEAVEKAGGRIVCTWRNRLALKAHLKPHKFLEKGRPLPRSAKPPPKKMDYYTDYANRGYLSSELQIALQVEKLGLDSK